MTKLLSWCRVTVVLSFQLVFQLSATSALAVVLHQHAFHHGELSPQVLCSQGWFMFSPLVSPALKRTMHKRQSLTPHVKRCCQGGVCSLQPAIPTLCFLGELWRPTRSMVELLFSPLPILHVTPRAAAHPCMSPSSWGTPRYYRESSGNAAHSIACSSRARRGLSITPFNVPSPNYPLNYSMKCPMKQITVISILFSAFCSLLKSAGSIKEALSHEGILSNRSYLQNGFMFLSCVSSSFSVPVC